MSEEDRVSLYDDLDTVLNGILKDDDVDVFETVWLRTPSGAQAVIWPMRLHRHGQDCARA